MTRPLTTLSLLAGCLMLAGCVASKTQLTPSLSAITESRTMMSVVAPPQNLKTWYCECWFMTNNVWGDMTLEFQHNDDLTSTNWVTETSYLLTTVSNQFTVTLDQPQRFYRAVIY